MRPFALLLPVLCLVGLVACTPTTVQSGAATSPPAIPPGCETASVRFDLQRGWNLIAGSPALQGVAGPFWTLRDEQYVQIPADQLTWGVGYWVFVDQRVTVSAAMPTQGLGGACAVEAAHPVTCAGWGLFGNSLAGRLYVEPLPGERIYRYDPATGAYVGTTEVEAGEGVVLWVPPEACGTSRARIDWRTPAWPAAAARTRRPRRHRAPGWTLSWSSRSMGSALRRKL